MNRQPLVSIIIPTFNRADLIGETLESIIAQSYHNWECIVVDDGSTDKTVEILNEYHKIDNRFKIYIRPINLPKSGNTCRNYGYEKSKGDLIVFFDSDDVMLDDFLTSRVHLFDNQIQVVFATYTTVDENLNFLKQNSFSVSDLLVKEYMIWNFPILTHSALIRKEFLENKILFDHEIRRGQETDFYLNILPDLTEDQFLYVEKPTFLYRLHDNSISSQAYHYNSLYIPSLIKVRYKALEVGIKLNNKELINNSYKHLILLLMSIIKQGDKKNLSVLIEFIKKIKVLSLSQKLQIIILSYILIFTRLTPKKLEYKWIKFIK